MAEGHGPMSVCEGEGLGYRFCASVRRHSARIRAGLQEDRVRRRTGKGAG